MAAQELQGGRRVVAGEATAQEEDRDRQAAIFREREDELLARHPDKFIVVCGGEVFVGDTEDGVVSRAEAAHPGRPFFLRMHYPPVAEGEDPYADGGTAAKIDPGVEADLLRQEKAYNEQEDELLARHPGKVIGVCAGEVFVGDDGNEVLSKAEAVYPDRPVFMSGREEFCGCW